MAQELSRPDGVWSSVVTRKTNSFNEEMVMNATEEKSKKNTQSEIYVSKAFLNSAVDRLVDLVGPFGAPLVNDTAVNMGVALDALPKTQLREFIYQVSEQIPEIKTRIAFKSVMLDQVLLYDKAIVS
jgi:hypothetical protein